MIIDRPMPGDDNLPDENFGDPLPPDPPLAQPECSTCGSEDPDAGRAYRLTDDEEAEGNLCPDAWHPQNRTCPQCGERREDADAWEPPCPAPFHQFARCDGDCYLCPPGRCRRDPAPASPQPEGGETWAERVEGESWVCPRCGDEGPPNSSCGWHERDEPRKPRRS